MTQVEDRISQNATSTARPIVLMVGDFCSGSSERSLSEGFRKLGWMVHEIDRRAYSLSTGRSVVLRSAARLLAPRIEASYHAAILNACRTIRPTFLFTVKGIGITRHLLRQIKAGDVITVMYYPDIEFNHFGVDATALDEYDLFITTKSYQVGWLADRLGTDRVAYVPHGYCDAVHQPLTYELYGHGHRYDALYAGNHSSYKESWLARLLEISPRMDLAVAGNRWRSRLSIPSSAYLGPLSGVAYSRAIQSARINIALHFGPTTSDWQDLVSTRTFEIPACGGFMLHIDNSEVREFFTPGFEIDVFSSVEELYDKFHFYLRHPKLRQKMIERAYARCVPAYGYAHRAREIHGVLAKRQLLSVPDGNSAAPSPPDAEVPT